MSEVNVIVVHIVVVALKKAQVHAKARDSIGIYNSWPFSYILCCAIYHDDFIGDVSIYKVDLSDLPICVIFYVWCSFGVSFLLSSGC